MAQGHYIHLITIKQEQGQIFTVIHKDIITIVFWYIVFMKVRTALLPTNKSVNQNLKKKFYRKGIYIPCLMTNSCMYFIKACNNLVNVQYIIYNFFGRTIPRMRSVTPVTLFLEDRNAMVDTLAKHVFVTQLTLTVFRY